jgi:O-methyltransferase
MRAWLSQAWLRASGRSLATNPGLPSELSQLADYSMSTLRVLRNQYLLGQSIVWRQIAGDFVECGVCNGGSAAAVGLALRDTGRHLWLYDSFEGLPTPKEIDGPDAPMYERRCVGSEEAVRAALRIARIADKAYTIRKGWFNETFARPLPDAIAFLHVDADWYDSVLLALETMYDRVTEGGIILLDDFGHWEGCRQAYYDFTATRHLRPLLERFEHSQAFWIKGRLHNRDSFIDLDSISQ